MEVREGYKNTEVGVIPVDWKVVILKDVCNRIGVGLATSVTKYYRKRGIPIIRNMNIKDGYFDGSDILFLDEKFSKSNTSKLAKSGDVLTVHTGSNIGLTCVLPEEFKNSQTFTTLITTTNKKLLSPKYLALHMSSALGKSEIDRLQVGGGKGNLNTADLKQYYFAIPPLPEQNAIAEVLSDTDNLIQTLEKQIAKKRLIKHGAMQKLLTPKEGWEEKKLGDVFDITAGGDLRKDEFSTIKTDEFPYPIFSNAHTNKGLYGYCKTFDYEGMSITISARGGIGFTLARTLKFAAIGRLLILKPIENINCKYVEEYINSKIVFANESTGVPQLTAPQVAKYKLIIPSFDEQNQIAQILSEMDNEIEILQNKISKYKELKQGLMQNLLTGKIRLV